MLPIFEAIFSTRQKFSIDQAMQHCLCGEYCEALTEADPRPHSVCVCVVFYYQPCYNKIVETSLPQELIVCAVNLPHTQMAC